MAKMFGPIVAPPVETGTDDSARFPNNILFFEGNYVPEVDEIIRFQEPEYDVIMCMSVTKWMHMNWGDAGIKKTFERFFKQLRAGGKLILEPQDWKSYGKKKKLTERIYNHYHSIELLPSMFPDYLINVVGFESVEYLTSTVPNTPVGFKRPIQLYRKPE
uniref:RNA methyltransferase n=1 Tax=Ciona savignyi TaxID=51511 RepID=H2Z7P3_CIOSA